MKIIKEHLHISISILVSLVGLIIIGITALVNIDALTGRFLAAIFSGIALSYVYPLVESVTKLKLPTSLQIVITLHILSSYWLGTAFDLYTYISFYDLILHGFFGFEAVLVGFLLIIKLKSTNISLPFFLIFMIVLPMGLAAMWELCEFLTDIITGGDCMHVWDALEAGLNPIQDTIEDMFITLVVSTFSMILFLVDRHFNYKVTRKIYIDFTKE